MNAGRSSDEDSEHARNPVEWASSEFDWRRLENALDGSCDELEEKDYRLLSQALTVILRWMVEEPFRHRRARLLRSRLSGIGFKAVMLAWVLNPELLGASPSLRQLAKRYHKSKSQMAKFGVIAARFAGFLSDAQRRTRGYKDPNGFTKSLRAKSGSSPTPP